MTYTHYTKQVYGIATYDALFKYVLSSDEVRPSFLKTFIPDLGIVSSERVDEHMNPIQSLQNIKNFLSKDATTKTVNALKEADEELYVTLRDNRDPVGTSFLRELLRHFDDMKQAFPRAPRDGVMDFVCRLESGDYAMVEMQVVPENYWDRRALAYVAAFYGNQLRHGNSWADIKKVIGVNILGGGSQNKPHWKETPDQFVRHYKVQEQLHREKRYMDGMELIQYSLSNTPEAKNISRSQQDWVRFFREGHHMGPEDVKQHIMTKEVLLAFERAQLQKLPSQVRRDYEEQDKEFDRYSDHTDDLVKEGEEKALAKGREEGREDGIKKGREEGRKEGLKKGRESEKTSIARKLIFLGLSDSDIAESTGLSVDEVCKLRK